MDEQISARDNKELGTAIVLYSTLMFIVLAIGTYGFVSLVSLATNTLNRTQLFG